MQAGTVLGNYRLERLIGRGGGGEVYLAIQHGAGGFSRTVAIKLLHEVSEVSSTSLQRLAREARIIGLLQHRNIVQVYEVGEAEGCYFLAMELVDGLTFKQLFRRRREAVPFWLGIHVGAEVCHALAYAHRKQDEHGEPLGIVHRDVKPSNVLLNRQGDVKLSDFGLAKASLLQQDQLTAHGIVKGTPAYMAPEQRAGLPATAASDVFALAMMVYEVCAGTRPAYAGRGVVPPAKLTLLEPALSAEDEALLEAALAAEPQRRPTAEELGRALGRMLGAVRPGEQMLRLGEDMEAFVRETLAVATGERSAPRGSPRAGRPAPGTRRTRSEEITTADRPAEDAEPQTRVRPRPTASPSPAAPVEAAPAAAVEAAAYAHDRLARAARGRDEVSEVRPDIAALARANARRPPSTQPVPPPEVREVPREPIAAADRAPTPTPQAPRPAPRAAPPERDPLPSPAEDAQAAPFTESDGAEDGSEPEAQRPAPAPPQLEYAYYAQRTHRRIALLVLLGIILLLGFVAWKERLIPWPLRRDAGARPAPTAVQPAADPAATPAAPE